MQRNMPEIAMRALCKLFLSGACLVPLMASAQASDSAPMLVRPSGALLKAQKMAETLTREQATGAQVVTLPWRAHKTYDIPIRVGMFTTFSFPKDEPIAQFAVSSPDAVQLQVNPSANVAMLKLSQPVTVIATVVTSKHIYYMQISPAPEGGAWYQGVSWSFDEGGFGAGGFGGIYTAPTVAQATSASDAAASAAPSLYTGEPNFNYTITGQAPFRPVAVWDNGRFTWIQFPSNLQELPALFATGPNGLQIVNYTVHNNGTQILVNRLLPEFVLKLGKEQVSVKAVGAH